VQHGNDRAQGDKRKFVALRCSDLAGFSRQISADEFEIISALEVRREVPDRPIAEYDTKIGDTADDTLSAEPRQEAGDL